MTRQLHLPEGADKPLQVVTMHNGHAEHGPAFNVLQGHLFNIAAQQGQPLAIVSYKEPRDSYRQADITRTSRAVTEHAAERFEQPVRQIAHSNGSRGVVENGNDLSRQGYVTDMRLLGPSGFGAGHDQSPLRMLHAMGLDARRGFELAAKADTETRLGTLAVAGQLLGSSAAYHLAHPLQARDHVRNVVNPDMAEQVMDVHENHGNIEVVRFTDDPVCPPEQIKQGLQDVGFPADRSHEMFGTHTSFLADPSTAQDMYNVVVLGQPPHGAAPEAVYESYDEEPQY